MTYPVSWQQSAVTGTECRQSCRNWCPRNRPELWLSRKNRLSPQRRSHPATGTRADSWHRKSCSKGSTRRDTGNGIKRVRLGYLDGDLAIDNAKAIEDAGANSLAVHARTKLQGYKPPAYWEDIVAIREAVDIPVVANGDIFSVEDARRCREITGCQRIMVGRGVLRNPGLPKAIASSTTNKHHCDEHYCGEQHWHQSLDILQRFTRKVVQVAEYPEADHPYGINNPKRYLDGRLKQWLSMMSKTSGQARQLFEQIKRETCIRGMSEKVYRAT